MINKFLKGGVKFKNWLFNVGVYVKCLNCWINE